MREVSVSFVHTMDNTIDIIGLSFVHEQRAFMILPIDTIGLVFYLTKEIKGITFNFFFFLVQKRAKGLIEN